MVTAANAIRFTVTLLKPGGKDKGADWTFIRLPREASDRLPTRSMQSVEGTMNGADFVATLEPDGQGGHWLKLDEDLQKIAKARVGDEIQFEFAPVKIEPEPKVPADFQEALASAPPMAMETWRSITPMARRDWIFWIVSGKKAETRVKRIGVAIDKLTKGNRRPCCFDRSGMYDKSLSCPISDDE